MIVLTMGDERIGRPCYVVDSIEQARAWLSLNGYEQDTDTDDETGEVYEVWRKYMDDGDLWAVFDVVEYAPLTAVRQSAD